MTQTATTNSNPPRVPKAKLVRRTRRIVNVRLLVISLLVIATVGVLGFLWHGYQSQRVAGMLLQRAAALEQQQQWSDAANYLTRYLQVAPADTDARLRLVDAIEKSTANGPGSRRLESLLYQTLGSLPEREDLRLKLAQLLLDLRDYAGAQTQAKLLVNSKIAATQVAARRILALSVAAQAQPGALGTVAAAAKALELALKDNPSDLVVAPMLANVYRQHPDEVGAQATPTRADQIMEELVTANAKNVDALIARYNYRLRYNPTHAQADLDAALALDPNHVEALLLNAQTGLASDKLRIASAKVSAGHLIELEPQDARGYISLARLEAFDGHTQRAVDLLASGRKKLPANNLDFDYAYAGLLLDLGKQSDAREIAADFSDEVDRWLPQLPVAGRVKLENMNRLIQARLALSKSDFDRARRELGAIVASVTSTSDASETFEALVAHDLLATLESQQRRPDLAEAHWSAIAELQPTFRHAAWKAAMANLELGRVNEALTQLNTYMKQPGALPEANMALVQARLQEQLGRPITERNWSGFRTAIEQAKAKMPNRWEWQLAEVAYLRAQPEEVTKQSIAERLLKLESAFPQDVELCERLVIVYQQLGNKRDAERMLKRYDELQPSAARRSTLRASWLANTDRPTEAIQLLADAAAKSPPSEQRELTLSRIKLLIATQQLAAAQELVSQAIDKSPTNVQLINVGLEIALLGKQFDTAAKWEKSLASASGSDNFDWRYFRARRLVAEYGKLTEDERTELEQLVESVRVERPTWFPVLTLGGQFAEAQGNLQAAIDAYRAALAAGDRRSETLEQLVRTLYANGQFDEATRYLSQVKSDESSTGRYESMAIVAAVKGNRLEEARTVARQAVERGSKDPIHYIWLANLMQADGDRPGAESTFRTALQLFPNDVRVWNGVFVYFVQIGQTDRARKTLERWTETVPMSEFQKSMVLGRGNEALGDQKAAQDYYRMAVDQDSDNLTARFLLAKSLVSTDSTAARRELDVVLKKDSSHADARRLQATLLAATGDANDWNRAFDLLQQGEASASENDVGSDERLRAILLTRKGKDRKERSDNYEAARQILVRRLEKRGNSSTTIDRMLLSGIYEQQAKLGGGSKAIQAARDTWRPVVDSPNVTADQLLTYIQLLLRYVAPQESTKVNEENGEAYHKVFADDARLRIDDLEKLLAKEPRAEHAYVPVALRMRLQELQGNDMAALKLLNEFVERQLSQSKTDAERAKLFLQAGNLCASVNEFKASEDWYRRVEEIAPNSYVLVAQSLLQQGKADEAVKRCLLQAKTPSPSPEVAMVLAQILSSGKKVDPDLDRQALRAIDEALDHDRGNVDLLMSTAVLRVTRNENDEAIKLFRRIVQLRPNHVLALNNLATMLSERHDDLSEAQQCIERAITAAGREPALLDTLGTILVRSHQYKPAVAALEEAVAGTTTDPRYYFHLAAAYDGDNRTADAQRALETAIKLGLDQAILTSGDRELLASLKHELLTSN